MRETPCTITRDVPEADVRAGQKGFIYDSDCQFRHVRLIGEFGQTINYVMLPADVLEEAEADPEATCRVRRISTADIPKDDDSPYTVRFIVAVKSKQKSIYDKREMREIQPPDEYLYVEAMPNVTAEQLQRSITAAAAQLL